ADRRRPVALLLEVAPDLLERVVLVQRRLDQDDARRRAQRVEMGSTLVAGQPPDAIDADGAVEVLGRKVVRVARFERRDLVVLGAQRSERGLGASDLQYPQGTVAGPDQLEGGGGGAQRPRAVSRRRAVRTTVLPLGLGGPVDLDLCVHGAHHKRAGNTHAPDSTTRAGSVGEPNRAYTPAAAP